MWSTCSRSLPAGLLPCSTGLSCRGSMPASGSSRPTPSGRPAPCHPPTTGRFRTSPSAAWQSCWSWPRAMPRCCSTFGTRPVITPTVAASSTSHWRPCCVQASPSTRSCGYLTGRGLWYGRWLLASSKHLDPKKPSLTYGKVTSRS